MRKVTSIETRFEQFTVFSIGVPIMSMTYLLILGGIAKVPGEHIADPPDVLDDQGAVQAQVFPSLIVQPLIGVRLHVGLCVAQHHGHGVAGHNFIDKEHQDGNDEENEHNIDKSLQQISAFSHLNPPISR